MTNRQAEQSDRPLPENIRNILVMKWSALGDVVIASTVFEDIRRAFPQAQIDLHTLPNMRVLFESDTRFRHILCHDVRHGGLRVIRDWWKTVRAAHYDMIIDLQCTDRSRLLLSLLRLSGARIPYRVGNRKAFAYNYHPDIGKPSGHALEISRAAVQSIGIPTPTPRPVLHVADGNREHARQLMRQASIEANRYAVFLPGCQAAGHLKRWGAPRYAALAQQLHVLGIEKIVLIGGPEERDECAAIEQACGDWLVNLCCKTDILDIVPLCETACFIVANDTGTAHIASVTPRPMLVICGPTDPRRVKPCGDNVSTLQADLPCINCYQKECSHHSCMVTITPEHVLDALGYEQIHACK